MYPLIKFIYIRIRLNRTTTTIYTRPVFYFRFIHNGKSFIIILLLLCSISRSTGTRVYNIIYILHDIRTVLCEVFFCLSLVFLLPRISAA